MPGPPLVPAGSQAPGLSVPTLLDGSPPGFSSAAKASGRQAKTFCPKLDTVFKNPDVYWLGMPCREIPPACSCQLKAFSMTGSGLQQLNWRACQNILPQYMPGFLKMVFMSTQPPDVTFPRKSTGVFLQPQAVCQYTAYSPALLAIVSGWARLMTFITSEHVNFFYSLYSTFAETMKCWNARITLGRSALLRLWEKTNLLVH